MLYCFRIQCRGAPLRQLMCRLWLIMVAYYAWLLCLSINIFNVLVTTTCAPFNAIRLYDCQTVNLLPP